MRLGAILLDHMITVELAFSGTTSGFAKVAASFYNSIRNIWSFQFLHVLFNRFYCLSFILTSLVALKWYLIMPLISISLMTNDIQHLYLCLLPVFIFSLERCLCKSFACFLTRFSFCRWVIRAFCVYVCVSPDIYMYTYIYMVLYICIYIHICVYICDTSHLFNLWVANIFSHSINRIFTVLIMFFEAQRLSILMTSNLSMFFFCHLCFRYCISEVIA